MRTLRIPFVNIENQDLLDTALETKGAKFSVDTLNWPSEWPYAPFCGGRIARTKDALLVDFRVSGLDLRALNAQDNGRQWEDSCVEVFIEDPSGSSYYNFEINALGKVLACTGPQREGRVKRSAEQMESILRISAINAPCELEGLHSWRVAVAIPLRLIGVDPEKLPGKLRANFYKCGDKTAHPHFVSWSPIDTPSPDFHKPEFFGELILG